MSDVKSVSITMVKTSELLHYPKNANIHSEDQINRLIKLIEYQGFRNPLVVQKGTNLVVAGNGRLMAAKKMGMEKVPVTYQEFDSEAQLYAYMTSDNAIASWAELDMSAINSEVLDFKDFDLELLGLKDFSLEVPTVLEPLTDEDEVPENVETRCKLGDIWKLGEHRLMCGDSTLIDSINTLTEHQGVDVCFTSPPYNLGDNAKLRGHNASGKDSAYNEKSDHKSQEDYLTFLKDFTSAVIMKAQVSFINIQLLAGNKLIMSEYWNFFKNNLIDLMIWDKEHGAPAMAANVLNSCFELIFIFSNEEFPTRTIKTGKEFRGNIPNIYRLNPRRGGKDEFQKTHGAVFPVAFAEYFLDQFCGKTVIDPFGGSGTTMIAAEKLGKKAFLMELDPKYCDVILSRWENYTGKKAELVNGPT
ncbi:MAG: hypothetical protein E6R04_08115 [Spirochaetes bacterium]|nr:MAG: hypothetical protein E6R04_08115 [Spirochaetota bacterium]